MALTCPSVADCIFAFSPASPPAGPTVSQWVTAFINLLQILLLACKRFILFVQIDGINLPSVADFFFFSSFFAFLPPLQLPLLAVADEICERSSDTILSA